jgi:glycosyltransferase involved in cell wall biosynthesis
VRLVNFHHHINIGLNSFRAVAAATKIPFAVTFHDFTAICAQHGQMITRPAGRLCEQASPVACAQCFPERPPQQFALRENFMRAALLPARAYISPSHFVARRYIDWGLPAGKFTVIENGLRAMPAHAAAPRPRTAKDRFIFGMFGRVSRSKGIDTVLAALDLIARQPALARGIEIRIHGSLDVDAARFGAALAAHDFAHYLGPYDNADVFALMAKCDYVLVPSIWWENAPVVIQEAYAAGRPVICTGIGGMAEKVPAGPHFAPDDPADLVRALTQAADPSLYKSLLARMPRPTDSAAMARSYADLFNAG